MSGERSDESALPGFDDMVQGPTGRALREWPEPPPLSGHGPARRTRTVTWRSADGEECK